MKNLNKPSFNYIPYLLSALLFGLSYPSYPYIRLEILAWFWAVPMLLTLKSTTSFKQFFVNCYLTMLVGTTVALSYFFFAKFFAFLPVFLFFGLVNSLTFIFFYFIWKTLSWRVALWTFPISWTACDYIHHSTEGTFGALSYGATQAKFYWLIQFADLTGVWGITFWVILFNVLVVITAEDWQVLKKTSTDQKLINKFLTTRLVTVFLVMLLPPLSYSAYVFNFYSIKNNPTVSVLMVQPNVDPWNKADEKFITANINKTVELTNEALKNNRPDLIIWPETAIAYSLLDTEVVKDFIFDKVFEWNKPLITGTLFLENNESVNSISKKSKPNSKIFNSALLLKPKINIQKLKYDMEVSEPYHKRKLMPFAERVPFVDKYPILQNLSINFNSEYDLTPGNKANVFSFPNNDNKEVMIGTAICYEYFYTNHLAEQVRNGAEALAFITNDGWFYKSQGQHQIVCFSIVASVALRRSIARSANTGITCFIDPFGRVYSEVPWWQDQSVIDNITLNKDLSIYVRYPNYFAKACAYISVGLLSICFAQIFRAWLKNK